MTSLEEIQIIKRILKIIDFSRIIIKNIRNSNKFLFSFIEKEFIVKVKFEGDKRTIGTLNYRSLSVLKRFMSV